MHFAADCSQLETLKYLIDEKRANFRVTAKNGLTPVHAAASREHLHILKYLTDEKKVDCTAVDYNGLTPVLCVAFN